MPKPFTEITTDAEYLRAVGMGPDTHPDLWYVSWEAVVRLGTVGSLVEAEIDVVLHLHDPDPARKWDYLADVLLVLGPEMDRRGWEISIGPKIVHLNPDDDACIESVINDALHLAVLEAFYNAHHAQGETP